MGKVCRALKDVGRSRCPSGLLVQQVPEAGLQKAVDVEGRPYGDVVLPRFHTGPDDPDEHAPYPL